MSTKDKAKQNKSASDKHPLKDLRVQKEQSGKVQGGLGGAGVIGGNAGPEDLH
jgi:hypothetical protein